MVSPAKLKLLRPDSFQKRDIDFQVGEGSNERFHSLFGLINFTDPSRAEISNYFIDRYSSNGEIVLDPFCGSGNIPLAIALSGRIPYCSDIYPLALCMTAAKLQPADITEVTLFLQSINLKKPVAFDPSLKALEEFYDPETLRELINLKKALLNSYRPTARFLEVVTWSLLNGNNSSYLSAFTNPQVSLSPEIQKQLNIERRQRPEYRSVLPRLLKKTAHVTSDGLPSILNKISELTVFKATDARDLSFLTKPIVNMILTSLPLPVQTVNPADHWLKHWFSDLDCSKNPANSNSMEQWLGFMNETLTEFARVLVPGRFAVLHLKDINLNTNIINLSDALTQMIEKDLGYYWQPVELLNSKQNSVQLKNALKSRSDSIRSLADHYLILKRK